MNEHDSEILAGMLMEKGFNQAGERKDANVVIINTCSVRDNADKRFFGTLGQLKKRKLEDRDFTVCVCGCMMQQQHVVDKIKTAYPWVDLIFGTNNIHKFPKLIDRVLGEKEKVADIWKDGGDVVEGLPAKRLYDTKALVNIMYGCNNFCTYCIVPYTRGRERSRRAEDIVREITGLAKDGVREVMLLGQNVNSYKDPEGRTFPQLLSLINDIDGIERIRFMTSHPKDLSDELIDAFASLPKLCKYLHLPVQSGSSKVLKRMNRRYTREHYIDLVRKLREKCPDIALSTDIIVGFPGETEGEFEETLDLVNEIGYDSAFTFIYSIRKGTPAEKYEDQIPEDVKHERFNRLVEAVNESSAYKNSLYEGRTCKVLVEGKSKNDPKSLCGRTDTFKLVNFPGSTDLIGKMVNVEITKAKTFSLEGKAIDICTDL